MCRNVGRKQSPTSDVNKISKSGNFGINSKELSKKRETLNWWLAVMLCLPFMDLHFQKLCKETSYVCKNWTEKKGLNGNFMYQGTNLEILSCVSVMAEQKASSENL